MNVQTVWEDEDHNRKIEMTIEYVISNQSIEIKDVAPTRVAFFNSDRNEEIRSVGVWTRAGAKTLVNQWEKCPSGKAVTLAKLEGELLSAAY
jgi:hypothetical protein